MKTNPNSESYKLLRAERVVFILREYQTGTEFIALQGEITDADAERIARNAAPDDWRKVESTNFESLQSGAVPESENQSE